MKPIGKPAGRLGAGRNPRLQAGRMVLAKIKRKKPVATELATQKILDKIYEFTVESQIMIPEAKQLILSGVKTRIVNGRWKPTDYWNAEQVLNFILGVKNYKKLRS